MIKKIEHIGIAVSDIKISNELFAKLLNQQPYKSESVTSEAVETSFFKVGDTKIELLEAQAPTSAIAKFIQKKGEGIHHIALEVDDIDEEIKRLTALEFELINITPKDGADNKRIAFLHPKTTNKILIELCQEKK